MKTVLSFIIGGLFLATSSWAQSEKAVSDSNSSSPSKLDLYVDCSYCDFDYFRTEITFVNFARERLDADIHLLVTNQQTGAGGIEYTIEFIGQHEYQDMKDTLIYVALQADTEDMTRSGLVSTIKMGLMRYVARTAAAKAINIKYSEPAGAKETIDKWNNWVFSLSLDVYGDGQKSYRYTYMYLNASAKRITKTRKLLCSVYGSYSENKYDYPDYQALSLSRSKGAEVGYVWALDVDHWAAYAGTEVFASMYNNIGLKSWSCLALEYNIFPYSKSTRQQLRLGYQLSVSYVDYIEKTIYEKYHEWPIREKLSASLEYIKPWGTASAEVSASNYFPGFDKNRLETHMYLSVRVAQGLSFNVNTSYSLIHGDQISVSAGGATSDQIILQRREFETSYDYWISFGVTYSFGSIYNNIVNPRFGS